MKPSAPRQAAVQAVHARLSRQLLGHAHAANVATIGIGSTGVHAWELANQGQPLERWGPPPADPGELCIIVGLRDASAPPGPELPRQLEQDGLSIPILIRDRCDPTLARG
jgi:hypothetical protein